MDNGFAVLEEEIGTRHLCWAEDEEMEAMEYTFLETRSLFRSEHPLYYEGW